MVWRIDKSWSILSKAGDSLRPDIVTGRISHSCHACVIQDVRQMCSTLSFPACHCAHSFSRALSTFEQKVNTTVTTQSVTTKVGN